ncbi:MAG: SusC/RagA family TonB-linked outer membrane protein [Candidatus Cryptobacteroides sp.]
MKHFFNIVLTLMFASVLPANAARNYSEVNTASEQTGVKNISGTVKDDSGEPLVGVSVFVENTTVGVSTDLDGSYSINVNENAKTLIFSCIGFNTQKIAITDKSVINIVLQAETKLIDEVVVVGYGVQKKASSVASITTTKAEDLLKGGSVNSLGEAIQGRLNGVTAINSSGKPGANNVDLYIRGKSSWVNSSPLIMVDGIERDFNDVDMNEIESISVLKDASATAVYGVRGANGVILVTTRRGEGKEPHIVFNASVGLKSPTAKVDWPDYITSMKVYNQALANEQTWDNLIPQSQFDAWANAYATGNYGPYNEVFPQVDWYDVMIKPVSTTQQYNISIDGGNNFLKYFVSLGYHRDGDIFDLEKQKNYDPRSTFQRYNYRANLDFNITKTTKFSVNVAGKVGYRGDKYADDGATYTKMIQAPINSFPVKYENGYWGDMESGMYNVLANMYNQGERTVKTSQNWYDFTLKQKLDFITEGLSVSARFSYNSYITTTGRKLAGNILGQNDYNSSIGVIRYFRQYDYSNPQIGEDGSLTYPVLRELRLPSENAMDDMPLGVTYDNLSATGSQEVYQFDINYARTFAEKHNVSALALVNRTVKKYNDGTSQMAFPEYREDWVGRLTYNYMEKYLAEFNISYTGSEKFAPGRRFGLFPSYSVGWRLSEEDFVKNSIGKVLKNLKFRYSWGKVGSDAGSNRFAYIQTYEQAGGVVYGDGNGVNTGLTYKEGTAANVYSTWETAIKQNLGMDASLWGKLNITLDLFNERRNGILMTPRDAVFWYPVSLSAANIGKTKNHGLELEVSWYDKIGTDWRYNIGFGFSTSENRVVYRGDPEGFADYQKDAGKPIGWQKRYIAVGNYESIDDVFNYAQTGISGSTAKNVIPGDLVYIDYNGDGILDSNDVVVSEHVNYPLTTYTLNLGISWKSLSLSAMFYASQGAYRQMYAQLYYDFPEGAVKAQPNYLDYWTYDTANTSGVIRFAPHTRQGRAFVDTDNTYRDADFSYLRLKTLELRYAFPKKLLKRARVSECTFYANGNNLFTITGVDGRIDPEVKEVSAYPMVRTYTFGVRLGF